MPPEISIIIPVYKEAAIINNALLHLTRAIPGTSVEIIVVDGDPENSTINAVRQKGIKKISSPKGRGPQMNAGAKIAGSDVLLFLHADTMLPVNAVDHILSACSKDSIGGSFKLGIASPKPIYRWIETLVSVRTRITRIPYGDQGIFIKKKFFRAIGGFANIPIMEDADLMRRIRKKGKKIILISEQVKTSPRRWEEEGVLFCSTRNMVIAFLFFMGVDPVILKKYYP